MAGQTEGIATFEVSPDGIGVIPGEDGLLTHTNHFLEPIKNGIDIGRREWPDTVVRLAEVQRLAEKPEAIDATRIKSVLRSHRGSPSSVCCHEPVNPSYAEREKTVASIVMYVGERLMEVSHGPPCSARYIDYRPQELVARPSTVGGLDE